MDQGVHPCSSIHIHFECDEVPLESPYHFVDPNSEQTSNEQKPDQAYGLTDEHDLDPGEPVTIPTVNQDHTTNLPTPNNLLQDSDIYGSNGLPTINSQSEDIFDFHLQNAAHAAQDRHSPTTPNPCFVSDNHTSTNPTHQCGPSQTLGGLSASPNYLMEGMVFSPIVLSPIVFSPIGFMPANGVFGLGPSPFHYTHPLPLAAFHPGENPSHDPLRCPCCTCRSEYRLEELVQRQHEQQSALFSAMNLLRGQLQQMQAYQQMHINHLRDEPQIQEGSSTSVVRHGGSDSSQWP